MIQSKEHNQTGNLPRSVDHNDLLELARDLDRFSRRFERFCLVQLEQLDVYAQNLEREKQQFERQRSRDLKQIQDNRRALQEAWAELKEGHAAAAEIEAPDFGPSEVEADVPLCMKSASDPLQVLLRPGNSGEMLIGQLLLSLSRLNRAHGGCGARFELSECYSKTNGDMILDVHLFPAQPLVAMEEGDISDDILRWQKFKSALVMLPLGSGLDKVIESANVAPRDHETAQTFLSAARRAQDGDTRTASSVKRGSKSRQEYTDQLVELVERHEVDGLALQAILT
ncbi:MAG: hypothetical protein AB8G99_07590 [Planctomycetaceae bacterium]